MDKLRFLLMVILGQLSVTVRLAPWFTTAGSAGSVKLTFPDTD